MPKNSLRWLEVGLRWPHYLNSYGEWLEYVGEAHAKLPGRESSAASSGGHAKSIDVGIVKEHFKNQVEQYEKYLQHLISFNIFHFAVTGAILSFYLSHTESGPLKYALFFPLLMSGFFFLLTYHASRILKGTTQEIVYMARFFGFHPPAVNAVRLALLVNACLFAIMTGALILALCLSDRLSQPHAGDATGEARPQIIVVEREKDAPAPAAEAPREPAPAQPSPAPR